MDDALVCSYASDEAHIGRFRNLLITIWHGRITLDALRAADSTSVLLGSRFKQRVVNLAVVERASPVIVGEARSYASDSWKRSSERLVANAVVLGGDGFWAGAARAALSGMIMFARTPYPNRVFEDLREGLAWLLPHVEGPTTVQALGDVQQRLRERTRPDLIGSIAPPRE